MSSFGKEMSDFLKTPGYSTTDRGSKSHEAYMNELKAKKQREDGNFENRAPLPLPGSPALDLWEKRMQAMEEKDMRKLMTADFTGERAKKEAADAAAAAAAHAKATLMAHMVDPDDEDDSGELTELDEDEKMAHEVLEPTETDEIDKKVIFAINKLFKDSARHFELIAPASLTVKNRKGEYKKASFIGGEELIPVSCYKGKKGTMIYVFKPKDASDHAFIEIGDELTKTVFAGFPAYLKSAVDVDKLRMAGAIEAEKVTNADRFKKYEDFGSW